MAVFKSDSENGKDIERDRIMSMLNNLEREDNGYVRRPEIATPSDKSLFFSLEVEKTAIAPSVSDLQDSVTQKHSEQGKNFASPSQLQKLEEKLQALSVDENTASVLSSEEAFEVKSVPKETDEIASMLDQLKAFADEVYSTKDVANDNDAQVPVVDEPFVKEEIEEIFVQNVVSNASMPFEMYLETIKTSQNVFSKRIDIYKFLSGHMSEVDIVLAIDGTTWISQSVAEYIYKLAVTEINSGKFDFAKSGLLFICNASTDKKYTNMALDLLQSSGVCSKEESLEAVKDVIQKEELLAKKIAHYDEVKDAI